MVECVVTNQQKYSVVMRFKAKPSVGEEINLPDKSWGKVERVEHFDGGRLEIYIHQASPR